MYLRFQRNPDQTEAESTEELIAEAVAARAMQECSAAQWSCSITPCNTVPSSFALVQRVPLLRGFCSGKG
jgi:hypothetical protein